MTIDLTEREIECVITLLNQAAPPEDGLQTRSKYDQIEAQWAYFYAMQARDKMRMALAR